MMSRHFRLSSELGGVISKRKPDIKFEIHTLELISLEVSYSSFMSIYIYIPYIYIQ